MARHKQQKYLVVFHGTLFTFYHTLYVKILFNLLEILYFSAEVQGGYHHLNRGFRGLTSSCSLFGVDFESRC